MDETWSGLCLGLLEMFPHSQKVTQVKYHYVPIQTIPIH